MIENQNKEPGTVLGNRPDAQHQPQATTGQAATNEAPTSNPVAAQAPAAEEQLRVAAPPRAAAGLPAIFSTMNTGLRQAGVTRTLKLYLKANQKDGFDCQSCAWPSPDGDRHIAEFCENGAKAIASEATQAQATPDFFARHSIAELAAKSDYWLEQQGRIAQPMLRDAGGEHYQPISWDAAFELIASELKALGTPDEAAFYTSGRASNEAAFLYQLFVRQFGTNNLPDCSNMCHESSGTAMVETLGVGKGTVKLDDFEQADTIFVIGQNPGTNHPRMLTALERAKHNGARIVAINPLPEVGLLRVKNPNPQEQHNPLKFAATLLGAGTELAELHLPVKVNGDLALFKGLLKVMLAAERGAPGTVFDGEFIRKYTHGFDELIADADRTDWDEVLEGSGVTRELIERAGVMMARSKRMIICWAMGLTQHRNAVATIQTMTNLLLLGGHIGRPGAGTCCVRGHSNVQGDRTMGIWERPAPAFLDALEREFAFTAPRDNGCDTVETIGAMHAERIKVFFALGGNFLSATPDTNYTAEALQSCRLTAHVSTKLNRAHLVTGRRALILPCLGRSERDRQASGEQFVTVEDSMGVISQSRGVVEPRSEHWLSEPAIVARLAAAVLGARSQVDWMGLAGNYDLIRDRIARVIPGFERFNERIRAEKTFYLPNAARERVFKTKTGKANFAVHPITQHELQPGELLMTTIRSHDQFNTTIYGLDDRYRGIRNGRRVVFLNPTDIAELALRAGQIVDLISRFGEQTRRAAGFTVVAYDIPRQCAATYFPEANVLVPIGSVAEGSNTPTSKSVVIRIQQH